MSRYLFVVMTNSGEGKDAEFNRWYDNQHIPDVLRVPGMKSAHRFRLQDGPGAEGTPRYLTLYEVDEEPAKVMAEIGKRVNTPQMAMTDAMGQGTKTLWYEEV